jgi:hypothetical protein
MQSCISVAENRRFIGSTLTPVTTASCEMV